VKPPAADASTLGAGPRPAAGGLLGNSKLDLAYRFAPRYRIIWIGLAAIILLSVITAQQLWSEGSVQFITALAGVMAIAAIGQGTVIVSGGIDLSVPAVMTLGGIMIVKLTQSSHVAPVAAIALCFAVAAAIGLLNGLLIAVVKINALITTLAMAGVVTGATIMWAGSTFSATGNVPSALQDTASSHLGPVSVLCLIGLAVTFLAAFVLRSTVWGRSFVAMGANPHTAQVIGIRATAYEVSGYVVAALLYMGAGLLLAGLLHTPDYSLGRPYQLGTIIVVALGGASLAGGPASMLSIGGAALFLVLLDQYLQVKGYSAGVREVVNGVILVAAVALATVGTGRGKLVRAISSVLKRRPSEGASKSQHDSQGAY
jgi:ribose/xylose/arabinose/galactoside ABC-type transport system permease subunit